MIADLCSDSDIRLITRNVMSLYSSSNEYRDSFIRKLKYSDYIVSGHRLKSDFIISYVKKDYNKYENIFRFAKRKRDINLSKFIEYLSFIDLSHVLWMHFYQLDPDTLRIVELLIQLSGNKPIIITDQIDSFSNSNRLYSLIFNVGLEDRLIIIPFSDISAAVNNSTCQCYVKSNDLVKIKPKFPNDFLNREFGTCTVYYNGVRPRLYTCDANSIMISSYRYSLFEVLLIFVFSVEMLLFSLFNWFNKVG